MPCRICVAQTSNCGAADARTDFSASAVAAGINSVHLTLWMKMVLRLPLRRESVDSVRAIMVSPMFTEADEAEFVTWLLRRLFLSKCELERTCKHSFSSYR